MYSGLLVPGILQITALPTDSQQKLKNILFFAVDDLRPELGTYSIASDKLASQLMI